MRRRLFYRPHLKQAHLGTGARRLPRGFDSCKTTADYIYFFHLNLSLVLCDLKSGCRFYFFLLFAARLVERGLVPSFLRFFSTFLCAAAVTCATRSACVNLLATRPCWP